MTQGSLSDPDFEPSDEDLEGLARRAFADVATLHRESLERLYDEIDQARAQVLERLARPKAP